MSRVHSDGWSGSDCCVLEWLRRRRHSVRTVLCHGAAPVVLSTQCGVDEDMYVLCCCMVFGLVDGFVDRKHWIVGWLSGASRSVLLEECDSSFAGGVSLASSFVQRQLIRQLLLVSPQWQLRPCPCQRLVPFQAAHVMPVPLFCAPRGHTPACHWPLLPPCCL